MEEHDSRGPLELESHSDWEPLAGETLGQGTFGGIPVACVVGKNC